jgi:hypothetical protein
MTFVQEKVLKIDDQTRDIFDTYIYSTDDTMEDVQVEGYFDQCRYAEIEPDKWIGGLVEVKCSDGFMKGFIDEDGDFVKYIPAESIYCLAMTLVATLETNCEVTVDGMSFDIVTDGISSGLCAIDASPNISSETGKVSVELKIDASLVAFSTVLVLLKQGLNTIAAIGYNLATGVLGDIIGSTTLATFSYVDGETVIGITLDQENGTATYSYKENNSEEPSANAAIAVNPAYDNTLETTIGAAALTTSASNTISLTLNAGTAAFVTNVDGLGYCEYEA